MPADLIPGGAEIARFLPEILLTVVATLVMVLEPLTSRAWKRSLGWLSFAGLAGALAIALALRSNPGPAFHSMLMMDGFATFFRVLVMAVGMLIVLVSSDYLRREGAGAGEYYALLLYSVVGQCLMAAANELIVVFIGLEISSIASYILAGYLRDDRRNNEAALKYFLLGSFATAFLLYGVALLYGLAGSTNLAVIRLALASPAHAHDGLLVSAAAALMFVGFAFKVSAAPFQIWAPDVYQGAPTPVAAFLSAGPKAAAFAVFLRVFTMVFSGITGRWASLVWASALLTMVVGNFAALAQTNVKRLLAYSSIAHAGYVMVAVAAHSTVGTAAAMFYLTAYAFMNVGAFSVVAYVSGKGEKHVEVDDLAGLGVRRPAAAALLTIFLLSLIGVPLTGGFFGKFYIFKAALDANLVWLTVLGLLTSAVAAYYYLRLIVVMYMHEPGETVADLPPLGAGLKAVLWSSAAATLALGIFPSVILDAASRAAGFSR